MDSLKTIFVNLYPFTMRVLPVLPENMNAETRYVHDEIARQVARSQGPVAMLNADGALIGPFPPMLHFSQFGIPALSFIRSLDAHATLPKKVREVAILTVGAAFGARFELYAHEIMAEHFGIDKATVASLASGNRAAALNNEESIAYDVASILAKGQILPDSTYAYAVQTLGTEGTAELIFLAGAYMLIAVVLNAYNVPTPETIIE
jgi:4-carboxymuconolactone decarboxylase